MIMKPPVRGFLLSSSSRYAGIIATVKMVMPGVLHDIAQRALQVHGALGANYSPSDDLWPSQHIPRRLAAARAKCAECLEHEVGNR